DALVQVALQHGHGLHLAAGLDHQVAARPVGVGDGLVVGHGDALAVDDDGVAVAARLVLPAAVHRVEVQQVGVGRRVGGRVVDVHEFQLRPVPGGAQRQTSDAAGTVDADFDGHGCALRERCSVWAPA